MYQLSIKRFSLRNIGHNYGVVKKASKFNMNGNKGWTPVEIVAMTNFNDT